ncbi:MAG: exodeoxyribonuclease VII large subunit [Gammaproteobacteria bacterium]|nr:MAG: exodeoxyribonuclease VII large subunit [Gammaproteobacteria bacterium]|tara:strand:- start:241 stop:1590 length:1350 start_codon:yes stop_codon:yes gene_type:complete
MSQVPANNQEIVSVSDINNLAKGLLEKDLSNVWIQGEISSFTAHGSGHWYFTIKDKKSSLSCVMFKFENQNVLFSPQVGDELILNGNISIYAPSGRYQFNVKHIEVFGEGALLKAFEDLKRKLSDEGLFEQERKKDIPPNPLSIGLITSETGAVFRDVINVLKRRSPFVILTLIESQMQGKTADKEICNAIKKANQTSDLDLIILARGGGSIEDLWCFNMESVARSIAESRLPIISAIGHETDFTISDFVADLRAPTPSAAAEIISQNHSNLSNSIIRLQTDLRSLLINKIGKLKNDLKNQTSLLRHPGEKLRETSQRLDNLESKMKSLLVNITLEKQGRFERCVSTLKSASPLNLIKPNQNAITVYSMNLLNAMKMNIEKKKKIYLKNINTLEAVSPLSVLGRGYSIVSNEDNNIISSSADLKLKQKIRARFKEGQVIAEVVEKIDEN